MRVAVGSTNRVKVEAVEVALKMMGTSAQVLPVDVPSGVPDQPLCEQTFQGARNRARSALNSRSADLGVGIEGGICRYAGRTLAYAVVYVRSSGGEENFAFSAAFSLPREIVALVESGIELGEAIDRFFGTRDSKHAEGAVGRLTRVISRRDLYVQPVVMALYPFINALPGMSFEPIVET